MPRRATRLGQLYRLPMHTEMAPEWATQISAWSIALRAAGRAETTITTRTEHLRWLARWAADRHPFTLTLAELLEWMGSHSWSTETRRGVRASLRVFYRWAHTAGLVDVDPAAELPAVRAADPHPRPAPLHVYRLALAGASPRERLMLRLAAECGMRRSEVAQVHVRDLTETLGGWSLLVHGKGGKLRTIPVSASIAREIRRAGCGGYAFPGSDHGHLSPRWVGKLMTRRLEGDWTMHALRHMFATLAYSVDRDVFTVQDLLGHASPATTRRYVQLPDDAKRALMVAVEGLESVA